MGSTMTTNDQPVPAFPPPPGVTSNFVDPESIAWQIPVAAAVSMALSITFCALRLYTSHFIIQRWHWDDTLVAIAQVFAIAHSAIDIAQMRNGLGRHTWDTPYADFVAFNKLGILGGSPTYNISLTCTKISILLFYLRFPTSRAFKATTYFVMLVAGGNGLSAATAVLYLCQPMAMYWDSSLGGVCSDSVFPFWVTAIVNMATDVVILLLPLWLVKPLWLPQLRMLGVACVLMPGGFVCGLTVVRVVDIPQSIGTTDLTWDYVDNLFWVIIEINVAIVCACLPCLKAFAKHHFPGLWMIRSSARETTMELPSTFRNRWRRSALAGGVSNGQRSGASKEATTSSEGLGTTSDTEVTLRVSGPA